MDDERPVVRQVLGSLRLELGRPPVGEENIREVIAFPKTQSGADPLTNAPGPIGAAHLSELGLRVAPPAVS